MYKGPIATVRKIGSSECGTVEFLGAVAQARVRYEDTKEEEERNTARMGGWEIVRKSLRVGGREREVAAEVTRARGRCGRRYASLDGGDAVPRELRAEVNRARTWKATAPPPFLHSYY